MSIHEERSTVNDGRLVVVPTEPTLRAHAARWLGRCFYACGANGVSSQIEYLGGRYVLEQVLKHDFLAATVLYRSATWRGHPALASHRHLAGGEEARAEHPHDRPRHVVCKIGRQTHFCLVPLRWLGRLVTHIEVSHLGRCEGIPEVPVVLARPRPNVYLYEYIEGVSLAEKPPLPPDFFDRLLAAVRAIHARNVVHFDLHKPGNILVDSTGKPHVIDFQLSLHIGERALLFQWLSRRLREWLQSYDIYHVCKHKRRLQPDRLTEAEKRLSWNHSLPLRVHRAIAKPYKRVRRACLRYLHAKGILTAPPHSESCPETDPARWAK